MLILFYNEKCIDLFCRDVLADKSMHHESKNAYYHLFDKEETADNILKEFGLTGDFVHIIDRKSTRLNSSHQ